MPYLWMLAGSFSFTVMGAFAHAAGRQCEWQVVALSRSLLVFLIVGALALATRTKFVFWRPRVLWMRSFAGSLSLICTFYALTRLQVSTVLTLTNTFPVWVAILCWPMLGILPAGRVWLAVLSGVIGVWFIQHPHGDGPQLALMIALASSLATAVAMLGLHKLHAINPRAIVVHFSFVATLGCVAAFFLFPITSGPMPFWHPETLGLLLGVGVFASIGQLFLTKAFAAGDPSKVSIVGLSQVVFALFLDLGQGHVFDEWTLAGMCLIVAPTAWVMRRN